MYFIVPWTNNSTYYSLIHYYLVDTGHQQGDVWKSHDTIVD